MINVNKIAVVVFFAISYSFGYAEISSISALRERLRFVGSREDAKVLAKELEEYPAAQGDAVLSDLIQIAHEDLALGKPDLALGKPGNRLVIPVASVLHEYGDEDAIVDAFAESLSGMEEGEQVEAAAALISCNSKRALDVVSRATRLRMAAIPLSLADSPTDDEKRALNEATIPFVLLVKELVKSDSPASRSIADEIRSEVVSKAEKYPLWKMILQGLDSELRDANRSQGTKVRARKDHGRPPLDTSSSEKRNSTMVGEVKDSQTNGQNSFGWFAMWITPALFLLAVAVWLRLRKSNG